MGKRESLGSLSVMIDPTYRDLLGMVNRSDEVRVTVFPDDAYEVQESCTVGELLIMVQGGGTPENTPWVNSLVKQVGKVP